VSGRKAAAAGDGIGDAGEQGGGKQDEGVVQVHGNEFLGSSLRFQEESEQAGR
jgi:hypothetical protein